MYRPNRHPTRRHARCRVASVVGRLAALPCELAAHVHRGPSRAQSTVEYALVLLGAAALALLLVSWVTGTDVIGRLFDAVFGRILSQAR